MRRGRTASALSRIAAVLYDAVMPKLPADTVTVSPHDEAAAYDAWFRAKVEKAMASTEPGIPHEEVMAMARAIIERHRGR